MWKSNEEEWYYLEKGNEPPIELLCGSIAEFDVASGISYRCTTCMAVVGSVSMPRECKALYDMEDTVKKLKGLK